VWLILPINLVIKLSLPGEYLLRFTAFDNYPEEPTKFYSVQDYVRVSVDGSVATEDIEDTEIIGLRLTPNPTSGPVIINMEIPFDGSLTIYNTMGQVVRQINRQRWMDGSQISVEELPAGVYWLSFELEKKNILKKLVVL